MPLPNKRYICSFVKSIDNILKPNVVVISARNDVIARMLLCEKYNVVNAKVTYDYNTSTYSGEGIRSIRLAETNTFDVIDPRYDNFSSDS